MAGKSKLEGKTLEVTLNMLNEVGEVLDRCGVTFALDGGTALGVVREGRLLPWDSDVDLAVDHGQALQIRRATRQLFLRGYRVRIRKVFTPIGPYQPGDMRVVKIWKRRFGFFKGDEVVELFVRKVQKDQAFWLLGKDNMTLNAMPAQFHQALTPVEFNGRPFNVPAATDEFLTYRYGDWRTPVKEWDAFANDGAIVEHKADN